MSLRLKGQLKDTLVKNAPISVVKYDLNGEYCVSGGSDKFVHLWNLNASSLISSLEGHSWDISDLCIFSDRTKIASVGGDKAVFVWDVGKGILDRKLFAHTHRINSVAISVNNSLLASGSYDRSVCLWDMRSFSRQPVQRMVDALDSISALTIGDCTIISGSVDGCVRCYDVRNCKVAQDCFNVPVGCIRLNIDESALLCNLIDSRIVLMDCADGKILSEYVGHLNRKYKVFSTFSYDDCFVASGSEDGSLYLWDLLSEKPVQIIKEAHSGVVLGIDRNPEKFEFTTCSADGTIKLWTR